MFLQKRKTNKAGGGINISFKKIISIVLCILMFPWTISPAFADQVQNDGKVVVTKEAKITRIAGNDRYQTAIVISKRMYPQGSGTVILASGNDYPDAIAGVPLAHKFNAPLLLTDGNSLNKDTEAEINRLNAQKIYILGGSAVIPETVESELKDKGLNVKRLGGVDRYATASLIAQELGSSNGKAVIAYGENYPDALAVSSWADYNDVPILLTKTNELPAETLKALQDLHVTSTYIIGGKAVISEGLEESLKANKMNPTRYWGNDQYETAIAVAKGLQTGTDQLFVVTGLNFPDALAGGVMAAQSNSSLILVDSSVPTVVSNFLTSVQGKVSNIYVLGGTVSVSDYVLNTVKALVNNTTSPITPPTPVVSPVSRGTGSTDRDDSHGSGSQVAVTFQTNGGSDIQPVTVPLGGTLSEIPTPVKDNQAFMGWFSDKSLTKEYYSAVPITADTTLYAAYTKRDNGLKQYQDPQKYIEDCDPNYSVSIISPVQLTKDNLIDYVELTAYVGEIPNLNITGSGGVYKLTPAAPYTSGGHYKFTLKNDLLSFSGESQEVRELAFRIHKDEVRNVKLQDNIKYVLWKDVQTLGDGAYSVPSNLGIATNDTVCFWNGTYDDKAKFYNIVLASELKGGSGNDNRTLLYTKDSQLPDILNKLDVNFKKDIPASEYLGKVDTQKIAQDVQKSAGTRQMTVLLAHALSQSPSFKAMAMESYSPATGQGFTPVQDNPGATSISISPGDLVKGLTVTASLGTADDENFASLTAEARKNFSMLTLTFQYNTVLKNKIELNAAFTVKEYFSASLQGYSHYSSLSDFQFDYATNMYSQTNVSLQVKISSKDESDSGYLDITKEINDLVKDSSKEDTDINTLKDVLGAKGDDIELLDEPLLKEPYIISCEGIPILETDLTLDFVVRVNFAAGFSTEATLMCAKQVGMSGSSGHVSSYENTLMGDNRYSLDLYCAGYLGVKAGLQAGISLSGAYLSELGKVGVTAEVGPYIDLYGFVHLGISKPNQYYDVIDTSLQGGLYMETGIYVEINLYAKSDLFKVKAEATLYSHKFPLFSLGNRYVLLKFVNSGGSCLINSESNPLSLSNGLLDAEYLDLETGETVTGNYADISQFHLQFSSPYFEYSDSDHSIKVRKDRFGQGYQPLISPQTKRLDTTVFIYYSGSNLCFSGNSGFYYYNGQLISKGSSPLKSVQLTWLDSSIDPAKYPNVETCKATYVLNIAGKERKILAERQVLFGQVTGAVDMSEYLKMGKITGYDHDFNQPILKDTVYTINLTPYQKLISFITYYDSSWHFDVYPVNVGQIPQIPENYNSSGPDVKFAGWSGTPGWNYPMISDVNDVTVVDPNIVRDQGNDFVYTGLDTAKPLQSFDGTYEECLNDYNTAKYDGTSTFSECSLYLYTAQYTSSKTFSVTFLWPSLSYHYSGRTIQLEPYTRTDHFNFGQQVRAGTSNSVAAYGYDMLGWDANGDGVPDYVDYSATHDLPEATSDMTLTAVCKIKTYHVTVLDKDGNTAQKLTVDYGNLPDILNSPPDYSGMEFKYWLISKSGGDFVQWDSSIDCGVYQDWTIKPVYSYVNVSQDYTVTIGSLSGGSITATQTSAAAGTTINLTLTPDSGKRLMAGTLRYNDGSGDHYINGTSFTMPEANVTVTAEFEDIPPVTHSISISNVPGGSITATQTSAAAGTTINLTLTPYPGSQLKDGTLKYNDGTVDHDISGTSFTMPDADVTVTAEFEIIPLVTHSISIGSLSGGSITATPTSTEAGIPIKLTITPASGKQLKAGTLKYNDGTADHSISGTSFTMPDADVTVTAEFEAIPPVTHSVSISNLSGGSMTATPTSAAAGTTINLTITPDSGKRLKAGTLKYNDGTSDHSISGTSFIMPDANVTVTAEFEVIPLHSISIGNLSGGSITATPTSAAAGTTINLTITPASGKQLKAGTLKYNDGTSDHYINGTSFTMPDANLTVTAEFVDIVTPSGLELLSAATDTTGTRIRLQFNKAMADPSDSSNEFTVMVSGEELPVYAVGLEQNPAYIDLNLDNNGWVICYGDQVTLSYTPGMAPVAAADGELLSSLSAQTVTNNSNVRSADSTLSALSLSCVSSQELNFNWQTTNYSVTVPDSVYSTTVSATTDDRHATMTVNGASLASGGTTPSIPLNVGDNIITVEVTAQDGSKESYVITVKRS